MTLGDDVQNRIRDPWRSYTSERKKVGGFYSCVHSSLFWRDADKRGPYSTDKSMLQEESEWEKWQENTLLFTPYTNFSKTWINSADSNEDLKMLATPSSTSSAVKGQILITGSLEERLQPRYRGWNKGRETLLWSGDVERLGNQTWR